MEQIREQLRRATGEETESPSEPSSDEPTATPDDGVQSLSQPYYPRPGVQVYVVPLGFAVNR
jgi:hypothetical protein